MRKIIMAALAAGALVPATLVPVAAQAQSAREVRESAREVRRDQRDLREARRYGDRRDVRHAERDLRHSRRELRQDWRDYRRSHRDVYRRPAYAGPRGYAYRPVGVGHRFERDYYGRRYWINDYRRYRLPSPGRGARWVRYGNDVALVNINNGRVLRVYERFFW
ncbi:RcnB family protein [Novosphingobium sp. M1R2S20]|uniref:RcnB family protein n=1 Tax=Novosphingobium rhizovicinum TaxID=3228928 RepID=A0ABV3R8Q5_9SPHN